MQLTLNTNHYVYVYLYTLVLACVSVILVVTSPLSLSHVMSYYMLHVIGICDEHFFASMFQSMDILHYVIHDTSPPQTFGGDSPQYRECFKMFEAIGFQYNHSVSQNICDVMDKRKDYHLRQCRILNPVVVDKAILRATLRRAETDRMNCMYSHPLYNQV